MSQRSFVGAHYSSALYCCFTAAQVNTTTSLRVQLKCSCVSVAFRSTSLISPLTRFCARSGSTLCAPTTLLYVKKKRRLQPQRIPAAPLSSVPKYASVLHSLAKRAGAVEIASDSQPSSFSEKERTTVITASAGTQEQPQQNSPTTSDTIERPRRRYTVPSAETDHQVQQLKRELLQTRLRLAKAEETNLALYNGVLAKLDETDRAAFLTASSLRYTGMALRNAHDNLEIELRRLLTIGLTAEAVDAAAIEAGARQYVRQNIGFHAEHVASKPSAITSVMKPKQPDQPSRQ